MTLFNKHIADNRKDHASKAAAYSALIFSVAAYRGLEEEDRPIDLVKLGVLSLTAGAAAGLIWGATLNARTRPGAEEEEIFKKAVKPVLILGITTTLRDMEDDRLYRAGHREEDNRSSYGSRYSSYSSYRSRDDSDRYPSKSTPVWDRRPNYTSMFDDSYEDRDSFHSSMDDDLLRDIANLDSETDDDDIEDSLNHLLGS